MSIFNQRSLLNKVLSAVASIALTMGGVLAIQSVANAAATGTSTGTAFTCESKFYQVSGGSFYTFNPATNAYATTGSDNVGSLNGIGYNPRDNAVYGVTGNNIYRIYKDGKMYLVGAAITTGFTGATTPVSTGGDFYPGAGDNVLIGVSNTKWTATNVTNRQTKTFTIPSSPQWAPYDIAIKDNKGYGLEGGTGSGAGLYIATLSATGATAIQQVAVTYSGTTNPGGKYGAAYIDQSGDLYFFSNDALKLYKVDGTELATAIANNTAVNVYLQTTSTVSGSMNDGASCSTAPSPFAAPIANDDDYGVVPSTTLTVNTPESSILANDTSGTGVTLKSVTWSGTTITAGGGTNSITVGGVTLSITDWTTGYFTMSGMTSSQQFTYVAVEASGTTPRETQQVVSPTTSTKPTNAAPAKVTFFPLYITKSPSTLTTAEVGNAYTNTMTAGGNTTKSFTGSAAGYSCTATYYFWSVTPALPDGLSMDPCTGQITGTPTTAQSSTTYAFTVGISPTSSASVSGNFTLTISAAKLPQVITLTAPNNQQSPATNSTITLAPTGGGSGNAVTLTSSTTSVCTVTGNVVTILAGATGACTISANQLGNSSYFAASQVTQTFYVGSITNNSTLPAGSTSTNYSQTLNQTGWPTGGTWSVSGGGSLPCGLSLNSSTGVLSATPPTACSASNFTINYTVGGQTLTKTFALTVSAPLPSSETQAITFTYSAAKGIDQSHATLSATSAATSGARNTQSTGLSVSFAVTTSTCMIDTDGVTLIFLAPGDCTIVASQAGGTGTSSINYLAATDVTRTVRILKITTTSLPAGSVNVAYDSGALAASQFTGGATATWSVTSTGGNALPSGLSISSSTGAITGTVSSASETDVTIKVVSSDSAEHSVVLHLSFTAPVATTNHLAEPPVFVSDPPAPLAPAEFIEADPTPTPTPTPRPTVSPEPSPSPTPVAVVLPPVTTISVPLPPTESIWDRVGRLLQNVWDGISTPKNTGVQETRSLAHLSQENLKGFKPNAGVSIEVIGAKTGGQFVVAPGNVDDLAIVAALKESIPRNESAFSKIDSVTVLKNAKYSDTFKESIGKIENEIFLASGLPEPKSIYGMFIGQDSKWIQVKASVKTYLPGTKVFLAVTTTPIIFGSAEVDKYGHATIVGQLPLNAVEDGAHSLRVVGIRSLDGVTASASGEIKISSEAMDEIKKFDAGTMATVTALGKGFNGGYNTMIREVPLERPVQWWPVWLALILGLLTLVYRYYYWRKAGKNQRKMIATVVAGVAGIPAAIVGWVDITYEIWIGVAIAAGFVLLNLIWRNKAMFEQAFDRLQDEVEEKIDDIQDDLKRPRRRK